jgi:DNA-binding NtrC family response regulator
MSEKPRVVILDDETMIGKVLRRAVGPEFDTQVFEEPVAALDCIRNQAPWLVFLDVKLSDADGFEVLRQILAVQADTRVVLMSGFLEPEIRERAEREAFAFLQKPFHLREVVALLDRRRALGDDSP